MNEFEIYWVAFFKHGAPQHLVAGPFVDSEKADEEAAKDERHIVITQKIIAEKSEW